VYLYTWPSIKRFIAKKTLRFLKDSRRISSTFYSSGGEKKKKKKKQNVRIIYKASSYWFTYHPPQKCDYLIVSWMDELLLV
jgi:hypothetical protein